MQINKEKVYFMKALLVKESMVFKRGGDSKDALGIRDPLIREFMDSIKGKWWSGLEEGKDYEIKNGRIYFHDAGDLIDLVNLDNIPNFIRINLEDFVHHRSIRALALNQIERFAEEKSMDKKQLSDYLFLKLKKSLELVDDNLQKEIMERLIEMHGWKNLTKYSNHVISSELLTLLKKYREEDKIEEEEMMKPYIFIGSPGYKEVEIEGETYHKKYTEIENLYQVDPYDKEDNMAMSMMKIRSATSPEASVYMVKIPIFLHNKKTAYDREISDKLRKYIDKNKFKA
jgi:hypothetical protein